MARDEYHASISKSYSRLILLSYLTFCERFTLSLRFHQRLREEVHDHKSSLSRCRGSKKSQGHYREVISSCAIVASLGWLKPSLLLWMMMLFLSKCPSLITLLLLIRDLPPLRSWRKSISVLPCSTSTPTQWVFGCFRSSSDLKIRFPPFLSICMGFVELVFVSMCFSFSRFGIWKKHWNLRFLLCKVPDYL